MISVILDGDIIGPGAQGMPNIILPNAIAIKPIKTPDINPPTIGINPNEIPLVKFY